MSLYCDELFDDNEPVAEADLPSTPDQPPGSLRARRRLDLGRLQKLEQAVAANKAQEEDQEEGAVH